LIHLVTVVGGHFNVLPHLLEHYRALGVESFFVNAHLTRQNDPTLDQIREITTRFGCGVASVTVGDWQLVQRELYERQRRAYPNDWFILADHDELALWPNGVKETIEDCDSQGYDHLRGCLIDRIARDGTFPELQDGEPVAGQFPLGAFFTNPVQAADPRKVVAVKGALPIRKGQHHAIGGKSCPTRDHYLEIHHFKWHAGIEKRLADRAVMLRDQGHGHWIESARFAQYHSITQGQINMEDPHLHVGECNPSYEHWERVKKIVLGFPAPPD
jgi:hypothetical protein